MISLRRAKNPQALVHLKDRVLETGDLPKEYFLSALVERMKDPHAESHTFIIIGVDTEQKNKIVGHLVAIAEPGVDYIHVYEAEYDAKIGSEEGRKATTNSFKAVVNWASTLGRSAIRMQTKRNIDAWMRNYPFSPIATVLEYRFNTIDNPLVFEDISFLKESIHGRRISIDEKRLDGQSDESPQDSRTLRGQHPEGEGCSEQHLPTDAAVSGSTPTEVRSGTVRSGDVVDKVPSDAELSAIHERFAAESSGPIGV